MIISSYWVISTINQKKKTSPNFLSTYHLKNIVKQKAFLKKPRQTKMCRFNSDKSLQDTCTVETGVSDFDKVVVTVLKLYFSKQKHNI